MRDFIDAGDAGLGVHVVGSNEHLTAGVGTRRAADRVQAHCEQRDAHLLAGGEQHVELARIGVGVDGVRELEQSIVSPPIAEITTTTRCPASRVARIVAATAAKRSTLPTEVPPNF